VPQSFTPFGNRRNGETWSGAPTTSDSDAIDSVSRRGYTGESTLGISMGLNHLNGRVEDAITGRFLSPDPMTGDPTNTQGYNRYSYVENNPATFTDPSGMTVCKGKGPACQGCPDYCMSQNPIGALGIGNTGDGAFRWMDANDFTGTDYNAADAGSYQNLGNGLVGSPDDDDDGLYPIAVTATYQTDPTVASAQSQDAAADPSQNAGQSIGAAVLDFLGKVWDLPNDAIGLVFGGLGYAVGWTAYELGASWQPNAPTVGFGGNGLQFGNNPFVLNNTAITFGNVETFSGDPNADVLPGVTFSNHEEQHTYQGQALGPLYLPSYIIGAVISLASGGDPFSAGNWMETGPWMSPPQPWPYPRGSN
jgi:RHS repeat-associated protein